MSEPITPIIDDNNHLKKKILYLERTLTRLKESQIHREKLEDLNRLLLKNALMELETAREKAEAANRAKTDFLANMSHEIRTPLNILLGMGELLEGTVLDEKQLQFVSKSRLAGQHLLELINNILELSKIEKGSDTLTIAPFDLNHLVSSISGMASTVCEQKNLNFIVKYAAAGTSFWLGDEAKIRQILLNLLANATKFTDDGHVTFEVISNETCESELIFSITDTGIGIPEEFREQIFERFNQVERVLTKSRQGGVGLGLAIAKLLTEKMGGTISLDSHLGRGSNFSVRLPLTRLADEASTIHQGKSGPITAQGIKGLSVLVVDDVPGNLYVVEHFLQQTDVHAYYATGGRPAVELCTQRCFDIVLMDICMPDLDGIEASRRIRAIEREKSRKPEYIVAMTAHAFEETKISLRRIGFNDILTKPFTRQDLLTAMSAWNRGDTPEPFEFSAKAPETPDIKIPQSLMPLTPLLLEKLNEEHKDIIYSLKHKKMARIIKLCHANKGVAGMYGFNKLSRLFNEIEKEIKNQQFEEAEAICRQLTHYLAELTERYAHLEAEAQGLE